MKKHFIFTPVGLLALALASSTTIFSTAHAAGYMKIAGIEGESIDKDHKGEIEILSWSWGETQRDAASGMATGKRQHKPLNIAKPVDKSSPILQQASTSGRAIPSMTVYLPPQGGTSSAYMTYELKNVIITSYQTSGGSSGARPTETFSLNYEEIKQVGSAKKERAAATIEQN